MKPHGMDSGGPICRAGGVGFHSFPGAGAEKRKEGRWEDGKKHEEKIVLFLEQLCAL